MKTAIIQLDENSMVSGEVINIIEVTSDTAMGIQLPEGQLSWDCTFDNISIGYRWNDGVFTNPNRDIFLAKNEKMLELSTACNLKIISGLDITLSDNTIHHFEYSVEDQLNISDMFNAIVMGATCYPYQPSNGSCTIYQATDIVTIYTALASLKTLELTYYHALKDYVKGLETIEEVDSVIYGQQLVGKYLEHYNTTITIAQEQMNSVIGRINTSYLL